MMGAPLSMARLLLIDQDPEYAERLRSALVGPPAIPLSREPGLDEASRRLDHERFDLILLDLPTASVDRMREVFERHPSWQRPPIIGLSGAAGDPSSADALEAGALDCLSKTDSDVRLVGRILRYQIELHRIKREPSPTAARFERLIDRARDIIATVDEAGTITYVSPAIERTLGVGPPGFAGKVIWELVHPADVAALYGMLAALFADGQARSIEFQMRHVAGAWRRLSVSAQLLDDDPWPQAVLNAADVTEVRRLEATLGDRDEQLSQARKMEVIGRLAGGIAHDFANLLTIIAGATAKVLDGLPEQSPLREHAGSIRSSAERASAMTRQLLGFTRQQPSVPILIDLNALLRETEQLLRRLLGEHIELHIIRAADLGAVMADRTQIEQVLLNLAVNARDAMPAGGRLTIETKNLGAEEMGLYGGVQATAAVAVSVTDTGVGMDAVTRARAFEPFFTTKEEGKGTGIGLASVYEILRNNGGWTHLASAPGRGTTVTFGLPPAEGAVPSIPWEPAPRGGTETLLLVEDEEGVRELVREMLELSGYHVLEASMPSMAERISREYAGSISLMLTDVVMPEMTGLELAARLQARRPDLQVMFMSGYPEPTTRDGGGWAPGSYFISKPFDRQALVRRVREALDGAPTLHEDDRLI
jgi:PAS domain S-box-containing protein